MFEVVPTNKTGNVYRVTWKGIYLGRLMEFAPMQKKGTPKFKIVDTNMLVATAKTGEVPPVAFASAKGSKGRQQLLNIMLKHHRSSEVKADTAA